MDLCEVLNKKKGAFDKILEITKWQKKWIEEENFERLERCIDAKSYEIKKINQLNLVIQNHTASSEAQNKEAIGINSEISEVIKIIQALESNNTKKFKTIMDDTKKEFKLMQIKKKVNHAYANNWDVQKDGYYLDKFK